MSAAEIWRQKWRSDAQRHYRNALAFKWHAQIYACELRIAWRYRRMAREA